MNVQAVHAVVHTPEQVRDILREASLIVLEIEPSDEWKYTMFDKACDLLGARATTFLAPQQVPFDLSALKPNGG